MRKPLFGLALLALAPAAALAQRPTATLRGTVTDASGALVAGARVSLKGEDTGLALTATTSPAGAYSFRDLPVGSYQIEVAHSGFKSALHRNIVLNVADVRAQDIRLEPGGITEVVSVEASAVQVKTIGGDVSGLVSGEQVRELPLNGRNFVQLTLLMPGVSSPDNFNTKDKGLMTGVDLSVSGSSVTSNLWTVDGANNNDIGSNRTILVYPSVDAIEEFKVHRNSYGAEFGQSGGAQINIVTRRGTNDIHGSAYYFGRDDALNSTNYFLKKADKAKEELARHDFGWTVGGPLAKDKLHFFVSQEWNREKRGTVRSAFVPTAAERAGDFSGPAIAGCSPGTPTDPLTGAAFPGNRIPADRLSQGGQLYLQLYPLPNTTPSAGTCNNWVDSITTPIHWRQENARVDWTVDDRTRLMVRYTQDSWINDAPSANTSLWGDDAFPAVDSRWNQPGRSFLVSLNRTIGTTAVNTLQFSYSGNAITVTRGGQAADLNSSINAAIPPVFADAGKHWGAEKSHPVFWGGQGYAALWNEAPFENKQDLLVLKDDYSQVFGRHLVKVGVLASSNRKDEDLGGGSSFESPSFWGAAGVNGWGATTGNILADFLLKDMTFGFGENSRQPRVPLRWNDLEAYVADSWQVHPRLTVDLGLRYSYLPHAYANDDRIANFNPALFDPALGNDPCNGLMLPPGNNLCREAGFKGGTPGPNRALVQNAKGLVAPRLGVAWDLRGNGKTALRAGFGRFYLRERLGPALALPGNPPFTQNQSGLRKLDSNQEPCGGCFALGNGAPAAGRDTSTALPNNWQWNLALQQELRRNTTLEIAYVGNKGQDILRRYDVNQVREGDLNRNGVSDRLDYVRGTGDTAALAAVRPYGAFGDARILLFDHSGSSIYHGLQTQLVSRFGRGSQFQASYTWSKLISNDPLDDSGAGFDDSAVSDLDHLGLDRGLSPLSRKHIFNASLVLNLPAFEERSGVTRTLLGDWQVATTAFASSGTPLTVTTGAIPGISAGPAGTGYADNQRPNRVVSESCRAGSGVAEQWLNPGAFTLSGMKLGTFGDSGRGVCDGPGLFQVDLALYKTVRLGKRVKAQLRLEVFNVLNKTNFLSVTTAMNPSKVTFDAPLGSATQIIGYELPASFGQVTGARDPRQMQVGMKLIF